MLILEDMHWADRSTRTFAAFLARSLRQERVCWCSPTAPTSCTAAIRCARCSPSWSAWSARGGSSWRPFDRDELGEALTDILGAQPEAALLERLFVRSEGNPLYTEELLAAGLDGRGAAAAEPARRVPGADRAPSRRRPARWREPSPSAGALDEQTLAAVTGLERDALQTALREAVAEQVLVAGR